LLSQPWFHGNINRKEASQKLSRHGTVSNVHVVVRLGDSLKKAVQAYSICLSVLYVFEKSHQGNSHYLWTHLCSYFKVNLYLVCVLNIKNQQNCNSVKWLTEHQFKM